VEGFFAPPDESFFDGDRNLVAKMLFEKTEAGWDEKSRSWRVLRTELASGSPVRKKRDWAARGGCYAKS
jgi:hypothetical protein